MLGNDHPRAGGGKKIKQVEDRLRRHAELTEKFVQQGKSREEASRLAFVEVTQSSPSIKKQG